MGVDLVVFGLAAVDGRDVEGTAEDKGDIFLSAQIGIRMRVEVLRSQVHSWAVSKGRTMMAYVLTRRLGYDLGEVAGYLGRDTATVGTLIKRMSERMRKDARLLRTVERLAKIVEM